MCSYTSCCVTEPLYRHWWAVMTVDGDSPDVELCFWIHVDLIVCLVKDRESQRMSTLLDERGYDVKPSEVENSPGEWRGSTSGKKCDGFGLYAHPSDPLTKIYFGLIPVPTSLVPGVVQQWAIVSSSRKKSHHWWSSRQQQHNNRQVWWWAVTSVKEDYVLW